MLTVKFGWPLLPATCLAAIAGALVGTMLALLTLKMRDFILKLTTLAFGEALSVLAFNWEYIGGANSFTGIGLKTSIWTAAAAALISLYVAWRFDGSRLGFACRAVRDDPIAASAMGVSIALTRSVTFALGRRPRRPGRRHPGPLRPGRQPARSRLLRVAELHHLSAVRRPADIVGADARCCAAHRAAGMLRFTNEYRLILYGLIIVVVVLRRPEGLLTRTPLGRELKLFGFTLKPARPIANTAADQRSRPLPSSLRRQPEAATIKVAAQ